MKSLLLKKSSIFKLHESFELPPDIVVPVEYTSGYLNWANHAYNDKDNMFDSSYEIFLDNKKIGIWPLFYDQSLQKIYLARQSILPPLINHQNSVVEYINSLVSILQKEYNQAVLESTIELNDFDNITTSNLNLKCLYVDLNLTIDEIFQNFRSSYRNIIKKNEENKEFSIVNLTEVNEDRIKKFRNQHIVASGKETRTLENWKIMFDSLNNNEGFVSIIIDQYEQEQGFAFINISNKSAIYSTGVYNRDLQKKGVPLAHICQWEVIKYLKQNTNVTKYYMDFINSSNKIDKKKEAISFFKSGFARSVELRKLIKLNEFLD